MASFTIAGLDVDDVTTTLIPEAGTDKSVQPVADAIPQRSELRVKHAQQDHPEGDQLGGALVTYKHDQGYFIHRFEEFGLYKKSLLRDSLHLKQNDQLVELNEHDVNTLDHDTAVKLFLNLEIGQDNTILAANYQVSTDSLRKITFTLYGFTTEKPEEEEEKPMDMIRVENVTLTSMHLSSKAKDEVTIATKKKPHLYLNKDLSFTSPGIPEKDKTVHFIRHRSRKFVNMAVIRNTTFQRKDTGFLAVDERENVTLLPNSHPNVNFDASFNNWGNWYIESKRCGCFLAERNRRLVTIPKDMDGQFIIKAVDCRHCL
ncbi:uncharacterized protein LOC117342090 isoform X3 [Pecten maximus]|uniref:uncharacterized protein LOC117342090 isoform X3 n=1 Tax=Pecten maximus TaxID=6579 RepID=UPI001457F126|nr:uncharacterized protein LOC117342090 isoform X3 [Pecten maximus]